MDCYANASVWQFGENAPAPNERVGSAPSVRYEGELRGGGDGPLVAGQRPSSSAAVTSTARLHLCLLGDLQSIVNLDAEIPDGALELGVPEQELNGAEIPGPPVDQRWFGASQ